MIPKIPEGDQQLSTNHPKYTALQKNWQAHTRMIAGTQRYGKSWCEVDLKEDLWEEIMDAHNYLILMRLRLDSLNIDMADETDKALDDIAYNLADIEYILETKVPEFEGETSAEWASKHGV